MRRVKADVGTVYVTDGEGNRHAFRAGDEVPDWAAERMVDVIDDRPAAAPPSDGGEPKRAGKGSGRDAWHAYAESIGLDVPDDASRDDIIAAVDAAQAGPTS